MATTEAATKGVHHVGLAVPDLAVARAFFVEALGFEVVGGMPDYPAAFVRDGATMITLWQVEDPAHATAFDRRRNIGLHHLAFSVERDRLLALFGRLKAWPGVVVDAEPSRVGPTFDASHFLIFMPGGPRLEFICAPALAD